MSGHRPFKELSDQIDNDPERAKRGEQVKREYDDVITRASRIAERNAEALRALAKRDRGGIE